MNKNDEIFIKVMDLSKELDDPRTCRILADHFKFKAIDLEKQKETKELNKKKQSATARSMRGGKICQSLNL